MKFLVMLTVCLSRASISGATILDVQVQVPWRDGFKINDSIDALSGKLHTVRLGALCICSQPSMVINTPQTQTSFINYMSSTLKPVYTLPQR